MLDQIVIESPEKIRFEYEIGRTGQRMVAYLVDKLIQFVVLLLVLLIFFSLAQRRWMGAVLDDMSMVATLSLWNLILFFIDWGYFIFFETIMQGRSPGKFMLKLRVIRENGENLDFATIALRNLLRAVDNFPNFHLLGGAVSVVDKKARRLGDIFCRTLVVIDRQVPIAPPKQKVYFSKDATKKSPASIRVSIKNPLGERDLFFIRRFLNERVKLQKSRQQELGLKLAQTIQKKTGDQESLEDPIAYLEEIFKAHSHGN
jgi:uncharacterized RDD family membrane protein YckC